MRKAVLFNLASAGAAILGNVIALLAGAMAGSTVVSTLPVTAGGFV